MTGFTGRCLCGAVRFECDEVEPIMAGNCHCRNCQRSSGAACVTALFFPKDSVRITGHPCYFDVIAESGNPHWHTLNMGLPCFPRGQAP